MYSSGVLCPCVCAAVGVIIVACGRFGSASTFLYKTAASTLFCAGSLLAEDVGCVKLCSHNDQLQLGLGVIT